MSEGAKTHRIIASDDELGYLDEALRDLSGTLFDKLITLEELLVILKQQYSKWTVYKWVQEGIPHRRIRGRLWFPKDEATLWIERS